MRLFLLLIPSLFISTQGCHPVTDPLCKDKVINIQKECNTASLKLPKFNKNLLHDLTKTVQSSLVDTQVWLGYYTPGSWFTLYGDVVRWGNWKLTMTGHSANHLCSHFEIDEYKKWEPTECKDSFPFCEKTERNTVCSDWNRDFQSSTTTVTCLQLEEQSKIYWVGSDKLKFEEAATFCDERNGSLAFFADRKLWEKVTQSSWFDNSDNKAYSPLYLGIRKQQVVWRTQADDTMTWTNWMIDEPKISLENTCVVMNKDQEYRWKTEKCTNTDKKGLCYGDCPSDNYKVFQDKSNRCYFVTSDTGTMDNMMNFCYKHGAELSSVPDRMTMDNISQILESDKHVWLSMTNRLWYSFNGTRVDGLKWRPNEPNNLERKEHCAVLQVNKTFTDYIIFDSACTHEEGLKALCQSPTGELWETSEIYVHIDNAYQECRSTNSVLAVPYHNLLSSSDTLTPTYWGYWVGITDEPRFWYNMEGDMMDIVAMGTEGENCMMGQYNAKVKFPYRMTAVECDRGDIQGFCVNTTLSEGPTTSTEQTTTSVKTTTTDMEPTTASVKTTTTDMEPTTSTTTSAKTRTTSMESSPEPITTRAEHMKMSTELTTTGVEPTTMSVKSKTTSAEPTTFNVESTTSSMESSSESTTTSAKHMKTSVELTTTSAKPTIASVKNTTSARPTITSIETTESTTSTETSKTGVESTKVSEELTTNSAETRKTSAESTKVSEEPTRTSAHITTPTTSPSAYSAETTITPATTKIFKTIKPSNQPTFKRLCACQCQSYSEQEAALEEKMNTVKKELAVQIKDLSSTIRSRTSAPDDRPSSQCIGTSAAILILSIFGIIFVTDLLTIGKKIKKMHQNDW